MHILIHMHLRGGSTTSQTIAQMLRTNAVLVRRTMAGLRKAGYVRSIGGPGGGWTLACKLDVITVQDLYLAVEHNNLFVLGPAEDNLKCPVEAAVNRHLCNALESAERALLHRFGATSLATVTREVLRRRQSPERKLRRSAGSVKH
jgi:DNA-binding IscR family transcriptional regulator